MEFNNLFNGREVIDGHLHIQAWEEPQKNEIFLHGVEEYRRKFGFRALNVAALPSGHRDVSNNIMCAFYKLANENTYAHGGLTYPEYPVDANCMGDMDPLTQYRELMEIGFDGIKMLEGKPNIYKKVQVPLCDAFYEPFFDAVERDGTHVLMHVNDPEEFWDISKVSQEIVDKGWYYGDGTYIKNTEMYEQIDRMLEKHAALNLTLAHFFFLSKTPQRLEELFARYEKVGIDITPGGEMYLSFQKNPAYFRNFFIRYADRIQFGTDGAFPADMPAMEWLADRIYRYLATDDDVMAWGEEPMKGLKLPEEAIDKIFCGNFVRKVSEKPREINRKALKAYIEKYKYLIREPQIFRKVEILTREILG